MLEEQGKPPRRTGVPADFTVPASIPDRYVPRRSSGWTSTAASHGDGLHGDKPKKEAPTPPPPAPSPSIPRTTWKGSSLPSPVRRTWPTSGRPCKHPGPPAPGARRPRAPRGRVLLRGIPHQRRRRLHLQLRLRLLRELLILGGGYAIHGESNLLPALDALFADGGGGIISHSASPPGTPRQGGVSRWRQARKNREKPRKNFKKTIDFFGGGKYNNVAVNVCVMLTL